jgi:Zn-finger nucleic acid-binding protein
MGRRNYRKRSGVIIDQCHEHGTWLDAHELERIAGWVLSGKAARAEQASIRLREEREQLAARAATQRVERSTIELGSPGRSVFGGRRETSGVGTILDLLVSLLD